MKTRILLWIPLSTMIALILLLLFGVLSPTISMTSLLLGGVIAIRLTSFEETEADKFFWDWLRPQWSFSFLLIGFFLLAGFFQNLSLLTVSDGQYAVGNPNNLGDLPLHINYIRAFARGLHFWPQNTEFAGELLKYPFALDLWNALFESIGVPLRAHLFVVGIMGLLLTAEGLSRRAGLWALSAFFVSGGFVLGGGLPGFFSGVGWGPGTTVDWKNLFLSVFVTQRGFLFALPAGLWLLDQSREKTNGIKGQIQSGIIWGALAFFHLHSFFVLSLFMIGRFVIRGELKSRSMSILLAGFLALPYLALVVLQGEGARNALGLSPGWTFAARQHEMDFVSYCLQNFSSFIPVLVLLIFALGARTAEYQRREIVFLLLLWIVFFNFRVAPWPWDNIKVLIWVYLLIQFEFFDLCWSTYGDLKRNFILVLVFLPGFFQLASSFPVTNRLNKIGPPVAIADCIRTQIKPNDTVVATSEYDHALYFQGMKMALGYEGHVWSHGYNLGNRKSLIEKILTRSEGWPLAAKELDAKWLVRRKNEQDLRLSQWDSVPEMGTECGDLVYDLSKIDKKNSGKTQTPDFDFGEPDNHSPTGAGSSR